jgi:hypothetical protein
MMGGSLAHVKISVFLVKFFIRQNGIAAMQKLHGSKTSIQKQSIAEKVKELIKINRTTNHVAANYSGTVDWAK